MDLSRTGGSSVVHRTVWLTWGTIPLKKVKATTVKGNFRKGSLHAYASNDKNNYKI